MHSSHKPHAPVLLTFLIPQICFLILRAVEQLKAIEAISSEQADSSLEEFVGV